MHSPSDDPGSPRPFYYGNSTEPVTIGLNFVGMAETNEGLASIVMSCE